MSGSPSCVVFLSSVKQFLCTNASFLCRVSVPMSAFCVVFLYQCQLSVSCFCTNVSFLCRVSAPMSAFCVVFLYQFQLSVSCFCTNVTFCVFSVCPGVSFLCLDSVSVSAFHVVSLSQCHFCDCFDPYCVTAKCH